MSPEATVSQYVLCVCHRISTVPLGTKHKESAQLDEPSADSFASVIMHYGGYY